LIMEKRKLLITGCGRSGTFYSTEVWRQLGLDIRHERPIAHHGVMGEDGAASWLMAVNDPNPPFGPSAVDYDFDTVVHQVRHPLKVIASVAQFILGKGRFAKEFIQRNVPQTGILDDELSLNTHQQLILQAARYWYYWNLISEEKATVTVQVEQLERSLPFMCELVDAEYRRDVLSKIPTQINGRRYYLNEELWAVDWKDLEGLDLDLTEKIRNLAARYGYDL
jgi:hypothetical protein